MTLTHVVVSRRMLDVGGRLGARTVEGHRGLWRRGKVPTRRSWCSCKCGIGDRGSRGWSLLRERVVAVVEWRGAGRVNSRRGRMGSQRNVRRSGERGSRGSSRGRRAGEGYKGGRACPAHEAQRECVCICVCVWRRNGWMGGWVEAKEEVGSAVDQRARCLRAVAVAAGSLCCCSMLRGAVRTKEINADRDARRDTDRAPFRVE